MLVVSLQRHTKILLAGLALLSTSLQATIELRRNNATAVLNGTGIPTGTGVLDDVRVGGIHHRTQRRNVQDLTVTGSTRLWGDTTVGRLDANDHLKRADLTVFGDDVVSSQTDACKQRREGWVSFDVHKDLLQIKFCRDEQLATEESQARRGKQLGAAWVELYYCGSCGLPELSREPQGQREIVFVNRGIMMLPCKSLQVGECSTFDLGTFLTPTLPAECGVVRDHFCFLQPCVTYSMGRNASFLCLVPNLDDNPVCEELVSGQPPLLILPKLGDDSCDENDARVNAFSENDLPIFFDVDVDQHPEARLFSKEGCLFYRIISCDMVDVKVVSRDDVRNGGKLPCPPSNICGTTCCEDGEICIEGQCVTEEEV